MKPKNAEELREEFIKKYAPSILDKNSNTSFVLDLAVLLESFASLREKETAIEFFKHQVGHIYDIFMHKIGIIGERKLIQNFEEWYTKHKEG